jgi:hypothetical protein
MDAAANQGKMVGKSISGRKKYLKERISES